MASTDMKANGDELQNGVDTSYVSTSSEKNETVAGEQKKIEFIPFFSDEFQPAAA
jgi:hypothetical protein